jgi:predicted oxidoreductase
MSNLPQIRLADDLAISRIVHGHWRLSDWKMSDEGLLKLTEEAVALGITTFDSADIYGDYSCEKAFGDALALNKNLRGRIRIITKCGIKLVSSKFPDNRLKHYDYSFSHILGSVENSLKNFRTDHIDLLLLHRPAPFFDPEETAKAFSHLKKQGKVLHFGVSNFNPRQFEMLNSFMEEKLVTNQVEISPWWLEHFENGNMDFFLKEKIHPMAWSPLAGGRLFHPQDEKGGRILQALIEVGKELNTDSTEKVIFCWLLSHPVTIIPVAGSGKIERIRNATEALNMKMSLEQWYRIYNASTGVELP